jgi:Raf kinase inhibitor-like YbhB/YbcL family protein
MVHTCDGANTSPQLAWTNPPAGALSFAVVFTDNSNNLIHSVIYDIPPTVTELPADVEKVFEPTDVPGAKQTRSFAGTLGYRGPCPPSLHTYEFALYALDIAALPNLTSNSTTMQGEAQILMHDIAVATLTGTYERP